MVTLCEASEKAKVIVNKCLEKGYNIDISQLEQLLVLIQGSTLARYNRTFFNQSIIATEDGLIIREIERDFSGYALCFERSLEENMILLEHENDIADSIIERFGVYSANSLKGSIILNLLVKTCYQNGTPTIVPNEFIKDVFIDYGFGQESEKIEYVQTGDKIDFSKKYAHLMPEDVVFPKRWLPNPETGEVSTEHDVFELAETAIENGFVENYCLSDEQVKQIRLIRHYKKNYINK